MLKKHNAVTPVRLELAALRSRVKHSTTEPLRSHGVMNKDPDMKFSLCVFVPGYNMDIMRQSACLVVNIITVYSYGFLFNCATVDQASDSMTALT